MIVITGAAGFVGINLARYLAEQGRDILLVDRMDRFGRLSSLRDLPRVRFLFQNLTDDLLEDVIPAGSTIVHLAALAHVDYSMQFPDEVVHNNILSTLNVLKVSRALNCRFLFASSVEVYGTSNGESLDETSALHPLSPYASSKVACEAVVKNYVDSLGMLGVMVRLTNLYGPWQTPDRIIPRLIAQSLIGLAGEVDLGKKRDYLFIDDAVSALIKLIDGNHWTGETFNISSGSAVSNYEIADYIATYSNGRSSIRKNGARQGDGRGNTLIISPAYLHRTANWQPVTPVADGIKKTFDWYAQEAEWLVQFHSILSRGRGDIRFLADISFGKGIGA